MSIAEFVQRQLWDPQSKRLRRAFCKAPSKVEGELPAARLALGVRKAGLLLRDNRLESV